MSNDYLTSNPAFTAEPLEMKLKRLEADFAEAEWCEEVERITALDYEIRMTRYRISIGQTHDLPF